MKYMRFSSERGVKFLIVLRRVDFIKCKTRDKMHSGCCVQSSECQYERFQIKLIAHFNSSFNQSIFNSLKDIQCAVNFGIE